MTFGEFFESWKDKVGPTLPSAVMMDLYLTDADGGAGFANLADLEPEDANRISMILAVAIEQSIAKNHQLSKIEFAKHRMIHDRHMIQLMDAKFGEAYHVSSIERSLFMIYHRIPLIWIFSAFNTAKNQIIKDCVLGEPKYTPEDLHAWISALTTLLMIELNSISRTYSYFGRLNKDDSYNVIPPKIGHVEMDLDFGLQDRNSQIFPKETKPQPDLELF